MGDTPVTAQRLAEIRTRLGVWYFVEESAYEAASFLLDHIDTLTAKLAEVEADRDVLRADRTDLIKALQAVKTRNAALVSAAKELLPLVDSGTDGHYALSSLLDNSPSPTEGGQ
jgi:hypothetical protein